jgi:hypothetical protein
MLSSRHALGQIHFAPLEGNDTLLSGIGPSPFLLKILLIVMAEHTSLPVTGALLHSFGKGIPLLFEALFIVIVEHIPLPGIGALLH